MRTDGSTRIATLGAGPAGASRGRSTDRKSMVILTLNHVIQTANVDPAGGRDGPPAGGDYAVTTSVATANAAGRVSWKSQSAKAETLTPPESM